MPPPPPPAAVTTPLPAREASPPISPQPPLRETPRQATPLPAAQPALTPQPLQTYTGDFIDRVQKTRASRATVLAAEQDAQQGAPKIEIPKKPFPIALIYSIAGVVLLIAGGVGAYVAYTNYLTIYIPITLTPTVAAPITVDDRVSISGIGAALTHHIAESANVPLAAGTVRLLYRAGPGVAASSTSQSLFVLLGTSAPDILLRNIKSKGSMVGIIATQSAGAGSSQSPFFILSVASFNETFSGMLYWEPHMIEDLAPLFSSHSLSSATSTAATIPPNVPASTHGTFVDDTVANHDVRIYRDASGQSVLIYGYWNPTTLVIARDPAAFTDILGRLANARP